MAWRGANKLLREGRLPRPRRREGNCQPLHRFLRWSIAAEAVFFSCLFVAGSLLDTTGQLDFDGWICFELVGIACLFYPFLFALEMAAEKHAKAKLIAAFRPSRKHSFIAFGIILLAAMAVWLVMFPGVYTYDMAAQNEQLSQGIATSHWSLTYGMYLALCLDAGEALLGSYNAGFAVAMLIQLIFMSYAASKVITCAAQVSQSKIAYVLSLLFVCLNPFILIMFCTDAQDVPFAGLFALVVCELFRHALIEQATTKRLIGLALLMFLMCTIRNNGVYCLALTLVLAIAQALISRRKMLREESHSMLAVKKPFAIPAALICAIILYGCYGMGLSALGVQKTDSINEMLSIPSQQLARAYTYNQQSFTDEELELLNTYYDVDANYGGMAAGFYTYDKYPLIADFTKADGVLSTSALREDLGGYMRLWASVGAKNPGNYIEAFLMNTLGFWYPHKSYNDSRIKTDFMNYPGFTMAGAFYSDSHPYMKAVISTPVSQELHDAFSDIIFNNGWERIPLVATLCSMGALTWALIWALRHAVSYHGARLLVPLGLVVGYGLTLLLAPVAIFRYYLPIATVLPVVMASAFSRHAAIRETEKYQHEH